MKTTPTLILIFLLIISLHLTSCNSEKDPLIQGELKQWHKITLIFDGPDTDEMNEDNPFLNYRLDVEFTNNNENWLVPGFYAADGNAAETSANSGNKWIVRFTPERAGEWEYKVSFLNGNNIAVADDISNAESAGYMDGKQGKFMVEPTDKSKPDNRARGRLKYVGEHYLKFAETGEYFIKVGVDAPENFLAYEDFDATTNVFGLRKNWEPHAKDFAQEARQFLWQDNKGENILGAINYLYSEGLNVFSFLTFNIDGDDRNVFPHILKVPAEKYEAYASVGKNNNAWDSLIYTTRFDVSKLEQWERVFAYAERKGMFLHFKTHERETDHIMDQGIFGLEGKLYYRELIARFGHHLAMNWNLGEESNQPVKELIKSAEYVYKLDPYKHHLVVHTAPMEADKYQVLIGDQSPLTGASLQLRDPEFWDVHPRVLKWRAKSDSAGKPWALSVDEPGNARYALLPDDEDPEHYLARANALYGALMAGAYGVEWYFGHASPNSDMTCQDFRSRDLFWDQNKYAKEFFDSHLPFWEMKPADELTSDSLSFCLAKEDEIYAVYLPANLETTSINLGSSGQEYNILWFNPRKGGDLLPGEKSLIKGQGFTKIGFPPSERELDWLAVIKRKEQ